MRNSVVQSVIVVWALVLGGALEEMLPPVLGVGAPVLLASACVLAERRTWAGAAFVSAVAGALEDALSSLPPLTGVSFFLAAALLARGLGLPRLVAALGATVGQLWLYAWVPHIDGNVFSRLLVSVPVGFATAFLTAEAIGFLERRGAAYEQD